MSTPAKGNKNYSHFFTESEVGSRTKGYNPKDKKARFLENMEHTDPPIDSRSMKEQILLTKSGETDLIEVGTIWGRPYPCMDYGTLGMRFQLFLGGYGRSDDDSIALGRDTWQVYGPAHKAALAMLSPGMVVAVEGKRRGFVMQKLNENGATYIVYLNVAKRITVLSTLSDDIIQKYAKEIKSYDESL